MIHPKPCLMLEIITEESPYLFTWYIQNNVWYIQNLVWCYGWPKVHSQNRSKYIQKRVSLFIQQPELLFLTKQTPDTLLNQKAW